jgi:ribosome maturation factor RimP
MSNTNASNNTANNASNTVNDKILALVAPIVNDLKLDQYDLEFNGGILKITIDTPPGSAGGVTLDQLALVTRLVGRDFDHHDPIPGHYTLEVSSPGLERTLRTAVHFQREIGKTVNIRLRTNVDGTRRVQGVLIAADETTATVRLDDAALTERIIPIDSIERAKTVFQWEKGEKLTPSTGTPKSKAKKSPSPTGPTKRVPRNSPKRTTTKSSVTAGGIKPPPGPSDELDLPTEEESA